MPNNYTEDQLLRTVTMRPYVDQSKSFTLKTWDTYRSDSSGKSTLGYQFTQHRTPNSEKIIFEGEDFHCSPMDAIDSDAALRSLLSFLTLRPGDTDQEYFENYTQDQLDFTSEHAEILSLYAMEDNADPWDETDQTDEE
jgi:hypothetical protein